MAKKAKLTEDEKQHLEHHFHEVRDHALRRWYKDAHGNDPQLKAVAQARLQLQIWLREKRGEITTLQQQRDACKADSDTDGVETVRKKLKHAHCALAMHMKMSKEGIPTSTTEKARRRWSERTYSLEDVLRDRDLDKGSDFGVNRDNMFRSVVEEEDSGMLLAGSLGDMQLEDEDGGITLEDWDEGDGSSELISDPTTIWKQHALHIQQRCRRIGLPDFTVGTRLAFQKKIFDLHVDRERQLREATKSSSKFDTDAQYPLREGTSASWNAVLAAATFSEHSLWELTCPMLWRHFESGRSFDHPQWVPNGLMRIQTVSNASYVFFEFGTRSFSTNRISIPATVNTRALVLSARCHQTRASIYFELSFLARNFVEVRFPITAILQFDGSCMTPSTKAVKLNGVWMGPVH
ncbi:hypothetical protein COCVIDRAFT_19224 [Bipolaris victoriae FI3]|uniref:Uncharacterized protein n=1 Tax=Bipolaris victoriae (strain FI3) TaxID=930091 RepID=W7EB13_BIPV3|nr:hypothetical protein COCVIDRAFT_19224 [Bipolaris victoriae FI3]